MRRGVRNYFYWCIRDMEFCQMRHQNFLVPSNIAVSYLLKFSFADVSIKLFSGLLQLIFISRSIVSRQEM